ncbi:hypothetical protein CK203_064318 [Vitis vinifera]|uniref:Uncharacterized protein n=1 Tax=Vitis vinifera TaxID=29760 RepID=A0A438G7P5_VITVI|nr:hypothetical protein CK203_064318 [Vitis vinifera]
MKIPASRHVKGRCSSKEGISPSQAHHGAFDFLRMGRFETLYVGGTITEGLIRAVVHCWDHMPVATLESRGLGGLGLLLEATWGVGLEEE